MSDLTFLNPLLAIVAFTARIVITFFSHVINTREKPIGVLII